MVCQRKDGTLVSVAVSLSPVHRAQGLIVTVVIRDITRHKEKVRLLREEAVNEKAACPEIPGNGAVWRVVGLDHRRGGLGH